MSDLSRCWAWWLGLSSVGSIYDLLKAGGPLAMSALLFFMWWMERRRGLREQERTQQLEDKLLDLATAQTQATVKLEASITAMQNLLTQVVTRRP